MNCDGNGTYDETRGEESRQRRRTLTAEVRAEMNVDNEGYVNMQRSGDESGEDCGDEMIRKIYIPGLLLTKFLVVSDFSLTTLRVHITCTQHVLNIKDNTVSH